MILSEKQREMHNFEGTNIPKFVVVELTNACNYHCFFCAHDKMTRKISFLDFERGKNYLKTIFEAGVRELGFNGCGEPVLNKDIAIFVNEAKLLGFKYVYVTSNGSIPDDQRYYDILNAGVDSLKFSVNAINSENYARVHGTSVEMFNIVLDRIKRIVEYRNNHKLKTMISISCASDNEQDKIVLHNIIPEIDEVVHYHFHCQAGQSFASNDLHKLNCKFPFYRSQITVEGYVNACCMDFQNFLIMGDLNKNSFLEIWNGVEYNKLRKRFLKGDYSNLLCDGCLKMMFIEAQPTLNQYASFPQIK